MALRLKTFALMTVAVLCFGCAQEREKPATERLAERVAREQAEEEERNAQAVLDRLEAMDAAKAVVIGAIEAMDAHNNIMPGPNEYKTWVAPHLKPEQKAALDKFVWVFPGGDYMQINDIRNVEIGRVKTDYGDAVAYGDGSVRMSREWSPAD